MKICILGMGKTGRAMVAYLARLGIEPVVWDRNSQKVADINARGFATDGVYTGVYTPKACADLSEALHGANYIFVMTVAQGHRTLAEQLAGKLEPNQKIIIFNGNYGAYEFHCLLHREAAEKNVVIGETGAMLLIANERAEGLCYIKSVKSSATFATIPSAKAPEICAELAHVLPQLEPADNVIETSLNNSNTVLHVPIVLFNITRIENGESFLFYDTATTRSTVAFAESVDAERCALLRAMGFRSKSCLEIINSFWPDKYPTLYEAIKNNKTYMSGIGPTSLDHVYLQEDIPYGIAPIAILGKRLGVPTPATDTMLSCFFYLHGIDYRAKAPDFSALDLTRPSEDKPRPELSIF